MFNLAPKLPKAFKHLPKTLALKKGRIEKVTCKVLKTSGNIRYCLLNIAAYVLQYILHYPHSLSPLIGEATRGWMGTADLEQREKDYIRETPPIENQ